MKERYRLPVAVYLILKKDNKILLQKRKNTGFNDGNYGLPSGHIEGNESFKQAIIREAKEEIGIKIEEGDLKFVLTMHKSRDVEYIDYFFICKKWEGEINNNEPEKCEELLFADLENLPDNTIDYIKTAINLKENYLEIGFDSHESL